MSNKYTLLFFLFNNNGLHIHTVRFFSVYVDIEGAQAEEKERETIQAGFVLRA